LQRPLLCVAGVRLAVLTLRVDRPIACVSLRPDEQQKVFSRRVLMHLADKLACGRGGLTVDLEDDVAGLETGFLGGAGGTNILNDDPVKLIRRVDLLSRFSGEIAYGETKLPTLRRSFLIVAGDLVVLLELADGEVEGGGLAFAKDPEGDAGPRGELADGDLKSASIGDLLTVELRDDVAGAETALAGR